MTFHTRTFQRKKKSRRSFSKRRFIKNSMETWGFLGHSGTPPKLASWGRRNKSWMPFISKMDHKISHKNMMKIPSRPKGNKINLLG